MNYKDDLLEETKSDEFINSSKYFKDEVNQLICKSCKGNSFKIGSGNYLSIVKCLYCNEEICLSEG